MLRGAKRRALDQGLPFDLTEGDIHIPDSCPILGIALRKNTGTAGSDSPTLDKVVPELGYVKNNVRVISRKANVLKGDLTKDLALKILSYIEENADDI